MIERVREVLSKILEQREAKPEQPAVGSRVTHRHAFAAVFMVIAGSLLVILIVLPWVFTGSPRLWELSDYVQPDEPADRVALIVAQIQASVAFVQLLGGALLISVLYTGYRTMQHTQEQLDLNREQLRVSQEGQLTERFTRAIEQLGAVDEQGRKRIEIRLGGIYALERIARDSGRDHETVMEVLTAYVRENAPVSLSDHQSSTGENGHRPPLDIQAILTVIGRRSHQQRELETASLDLSRTNLEGVYLKIAHLVGASLVESCLTGADMEEANLMGANLVGADLAGANLRRASLVGADLMEANLAGTHLWSAHLAGAHLSGATLVDAGLVGADLSGARLVDAGLAGADLAGAILAGADLSGADLAGAILAGADLSGADLAGADLTDAILAGAHLDHVSGLTQEQVDTTFMNEETILPNVLAPNGQAYQRSSRRVIDETPDS